MPTGNIWHVELRRYVEWELIITPLVRKILAEDAAEVRLFSFQILPELGVLRTGAVNFQPSIRQPPEIAQ